MSLKFLTLWGSPSVRKKIPEQDFVVVVSVVGRMQLIDFYFPYESNEGSVDTSGVNITPLSSYQISNIDLENPVLDCGDKKENKSMWGIFILGILGGFIALLTPCVFPMIPLTVSFFTKGSENKSTHRIKMESNKNKNEIKGPVQWNEE